MAGWDGKGTQGNWRKTRQTIIDRDGTQCRSCGRLVHERRCSPRGCRRCLQIGHITPKALGGTDHPHNLQVECAGCNLRAGAQLGRARQLGRTYNPRTPAPTLPDWDAAPSLMSGVPRR